MTTPDRQDDVAAFEDFFERHHRELSRFAYVLTGDHGSADDLTGDAFLAVWRQWQRVQDRDEPLAYVRRMVLNMAASRVRQRVRERRRDGQVATIVPTEATVPDGAAVLDVRAALLKLPVRRRACVALRYALDLSEQEVADLLGISVGTVKSQTSKAVAQLQELLGDGPPQRRELLGGKPARGRRSDGRHSARRTGREEPPPVTELRALDPRRMA